MANTSSSSYSISGCIIHSSEEEEDMANCLIMLAHSPVKTEMASKENSGFQRGFLSPQSNSRAQLWTGGGNCQDGYECKTCNRSFPSFQALGGHRASHKKPKLTVDDQNQPKHVVLHEENKATPDHYKNSQTKVHQCSICGSEFLSGQALGGHMRRHRTTGPPSISQMKGKQLPELNEKPPVRCLDLNLPPPEVVDDGHSSFQFFSAAALVDCHY